jgi:Ni/Co efflux regulator RcnB
VSLQEAAKLNTLDLAQYQKIIVSTKALEAIIARVAEERTDERRQDTQGHAPHGEGQQAVRRARPVHLRGVQGREQARHRRGRRGDLQGHRAPREHQNYRGKNKRSRTGQPSTTSDYKKAIVTLKAGDKIELV